jgi:hypothetical protein
MFCFELPALLRPRLNLPTFFQGFPLGEISPYHNNVTARMRGIAHAILRMTARRTWATMDVRRRSVRAIRRGAEKEGEMNGDLKPKNKRTITVEDLDSGAVRITVVGPPYLVATVGNNTRNLATDDIGYVWLSNFAPDTGEDRAVYSTKHCTDTGSLHGSSTECDGLCHDLKCCEPADFFHHWKSGDGEERCIPLCKWHSRDMAHYVGRAVLEALKYGVVADLRFWTLQDPLPGGLPRCDYGYYAIDSDGDSSRARCTNKATTKVRVTEMGPAGEVYDGKLCAVCAERESKKINAAENSLDSAGRKVEVV